MTEKMNKADILYMELTSWLMKNHGEVYDEYQLNVIEEHIQKWRKYRNGEKNE